MIRKLFSICLGLVAVLPRNCFINAQDGCCSTVRLSTNGAANESQSARLGIYERVDTYFDRPVYIHSDIDEYLFYMGGRSRGLWMVGPEVGFFSGGLANRGDSQCVENLKAHWKFADGTGWTKDPVLKVRCEKDQSECFYADDTQLVGEGSTLNPKPLMVLKTSECIDACIKTWGCRYWTVAKANSSEIPVECHLKSWRGRRVDAPGFISGSLPSACYAKEEEDSPTNELAPPSSGNNEDKNPCVYINLEFKGGDLSVIPSLGFSACKAECQRLKGCSFFSINKVACILKDSNVEIHRKNGVISGATDTTCAEVLQHKAEIDHDKEDKSYEENEVNGKFRIVSEQWTENLNDKNSLEYRELSTTLSSGLKEMLMENKDLSDKADFDVEIVKLTKGSVVCNFKIRYVLKEAFVAVPFSIKPTNITATLGQGFQFKKGILFQRFVIARGSFKATSPVDHCDAKGCSHKCAYDYELEDYRCTCPPNLYLSDDDKTCREAITDETTTTTEKSVVVQLLPTDCLWSEWSDWTPCSATCGDSAIRSRSRKVIIPARNGGKCDGKDLDTFDCQPKPCDDGEEVIDDVNEVDLDDKVQEVTSSTQASSTVSLTERTRDEPRAFSFETTLPTVADEATEAVTVVPEIKEATEADEIEDVTEAMIAEPEIKEATESFADESTTLKSEIEKEATTLVPEEEGFGDKLPSSTWTPFVEEGFEDPETSTPLVEVGFGEKLPPSTWTPFTEEGFEDEEAEQPTTAFIAPDAEPRIIPEETTVRDIVESTEASTSSEEEMVTTNVPMLTIEDELTTIVPILDDDEDADEVFETTMTPEAGDDAMQTTAMPSIDEMVDADPDTMTRTDEMSTENTLVTDGEILEDEIEPELTTTVASDIMTFDTTSPSTQVPILDDEEESVTTEMTAEAEATTIDTVFDDDKVQSRPEPRLLETTLPPMLEDEILETEFMETTVPSETEKDEEILEEEEATTMVPSRIIPEDEEEATTVLPSRMTPEEEEEIEMATKTEPERMAPEEDASMETTMVPSRMIPEEDDQVEMATTMEPLDDEQEMATTMMPSRMIPEEEEEVEMATTMEPSEARIIPDDEQELATTMMPSRMTPEEEDETEMATTMEPSKIAPEEEDEIEMATTMEPSKIAPEEEDEIEMATTMEPSRITPEEETELTTTSSMKADDQEQITTTSEPMIEEVAFDDDADETMTTMQPDEETVEDIEEEASTLTPSIETDDDVEMTTINIMMSVHEEMTFVTKETPAKTTTMKTEEDLTTLVPQNVAETTVSPIEMTDEEAEERITTVRNTEARPKGISVTDILVPTTAPSVQEETTTEADFMYPMDIDAKTKDDTEATTTDQGIIDAVVNFLTTTLRSVDKESVTDIDDQEEEATTQTSTASSTFEPLPLARDEDDSKVVLETTTAPASDDVSSTTSKIVVALPDSDETTSLPEIILDETTIKVDDVKETTETILDDDSEDAPEVTTVIIDQEVEATSKSDSEPSETVTEEAPSEEGTTAKVLGEVTEPTQVDDTTFIPTDTRPKLPRLDDDNEADDATTPEPRIDIEDQTTEIMADDGNNIQDEITSPEPEIVHEAEETTLEPDMKMDEATEPELKMAEEEENEPETVTEPELKMTEKETTEAAEKDTTIASAIESTTLNAETRTEDDAAIAPKEIDVATTTQSSAPDAETTIQVKEDELTTVTTTISSTTITGDAEDNLLDTDDEDDEVLEVEDDDEPLDANEKDVHTLKCLPDLANAGEMMTMSCTEAEDKEPITVIISADGLDLETLARKNVKIVVKDYMLMEMQQRPVALKPRRRRRRSSTS